MSAHFPDQPTPSQPLAPTSKLSEATSDGSASAIRRWRQAATDPRDVEPPTVDPQTPDELPTRVLATASVAAEQALPAIPGYTLLGEIARGGMGAVLRGRDGRLGRELAIKVLLDRCRQKPDLVRRFVEEAQLTGQLEHPGIVPVHELGEYGERQPFFAMKLVQGETLAKLLKARPSPQTDWPRFLKLFEQVAQAVAFAHAQGVIHRDLKPLNVMVGAFGEVQVMDWGLAKRLKKADSSATEGASDTSAAAPTTTLAGAVVGTPSYMAPEQARGENETLDARADVFGLGAMLCEILTGRPAFVGQSAGEIVQCAAAGDLRDARERLENCGADSDLVHLARRCLAAAREDRPGDAGEVARAMTAYLHGVQERLHQAEIARATAEARAEEARAKAMVERRARRLLVGLAAALVAGLACTATLTVVALRQSEAAEIARADAETQRATAEVQRDLAHEQKKRAETNFDLARQAVDDTVTKVAENQHLKLANFHNLRRDLLAMAVPFYERFVAQHSDDPVLEADRGHAYLRLAYVRAEMGERQAALTDYEQVGAIFARLAADAPTEAKHRQDLAATWNNVGNLLSDLGQRQDAEQALRNALAIEEKLVAEAPADPQNRRSLGGTYYNLANLLVGLGQRPAAETAYRRALDIRDQLATDFPKVASYRKDVARTLDNLGVLLTDLAQWQPAEQVLLRAAETSEQLTRDFPAMPAYRQDLANCRNDLGRLLALRGQRAAAAEAYRQAVKLQEQLAADFPALASYRQELARSQSNLGTMLASLGQREAAEQAHGRARELYEKLVAELPSVPQYRQELANSYNNLGIFFKSIGQFEPAERSVRQALDIRQKLTAEYPKAPAYRQELAGSYVNYGSLLRDQGQIESSLVWYARAIALLEPLVRQDRRLVTERLFLRNAHWSRAEALDRLGRPTDAIADWDQAKTLNPIPAFDAVLRRGQARSLARAGDHAQATTEVNALAAAKDINAAGLYDLACVCALASAAVKDDGKLQAQYAARAVELLRQAFANGYKDIAHLKQDEDLKALRGREDYGRFLQEVEEKQQPCDMPT